MKISVVIPAFNEEKLLPATLQAIKLATSSFAAQGWDSEIIVCNNNSTDRTGEIAAAAGAKVVFEAVNQIARARNTGAQAATGDWLIFIDADSQPSAALFADVAEVIQKNHCIGGGATVTMETDEAWVRRVVGLWNSFSRLTRFAAGSFVFCDAVAFRELGGFSPEFYVSEEIEFSIRLKKLARRRGKKMVILQQHPLVTSARKMRLYTLWDYTRFSVWMLVRGRKHFMKRENCFIWYDGRR